MAPSKPPQSPPDDKVPNGSVIDPSAAPLPHKGSTLETLQETWEDIKDAVTETPTYITLSSKFSSISTAARSAWNISKKLAWVLGTTSLVLVVPLLYEIDKEMGPDASISPSSTAAPTDAANAATSDATAPSASSSSEATTASQQS